MNLPDPDKVVVTVAVTGAFGDRSVPHLPITPREIADSALEAHRHGASAAHIHVREVETGRPSMDLELYSEVVSRIRDNSEMIINLSTGAGGRFVPGDRDPMGPGPGTMLRQPAKRIEHVLKLSPEICSLDVGTLNFQAHSFINPAAHVEWMAKQILGAGVKPELEVFELGHIHFAKHLIEDGLVESPPLFQLCTGVKWGIPATPEHIMALKRDLPRSAVWSCFGIGAAHFMAAAQSLLLGGHVRVGLEDNLFLTKGRRARGNWELVQKAVGIIEALGKTPASPEEAKRIFGLKNS